MPRGEHGTLWFLSAARRSPPRQLASVGNQMILMSYNGHGQVHRFQEMALIISLEEEQNIIQKPSVQERGAIPE